MKIRFLQGLEGPAVSITPGEERDWDAAEATRLIDAGIAVPVVTHAAETAEKPAAPEKRAQKRPAAKE